MTPLWVKLIGQPTRYFVADVESVRDHIPKGASVHAILLPLGSLTSSAEGRTPNIAITLRNRNGLLSTMFAMPPIGDRILIETPDGVVFEGIVKTVELTMSEAMLQAQA